MKNTGLVKWRRKIRILSNRNLEKNPGFVKWRRSGLCQMEKKNLRVVK